MLSEKFYQSLQTAANAAKIFLQWAVVSALSFLYWLLILCIISMFLLSIWNVKFDTLVNVSIVLAVITAIVYAIILARRKYKDVKIQRRLHGD